MIQSLHHICSTALVSLTRLSQNLTFKKMLIIYGTMSKVCVEEEKYENKLSMLLF